MNSIVQSFENIKSLINNSNIKIVAVSKTYTYDYVKPLVDHGHIHFGENKVQEAQSKWIDIKKKGAAYDWHASKQRLWYHSLNC